MAAPNTAVLDIKYSYTRSDAATVEIIYSYVQVVPQSSSLNVVYQYNATASTRFTKAVGKWSEYTQRVCNKLPAWHIGRYGKDATNYQKFINGFGMWYEDISLQLLDARRNFYLETADTFQLHTAYRAPLKVKLEDGNKHPTSNLLLNSDFSVQGIARDQLPYGWTDSKYASTASVSVNGITDAVAGGNCVTIDAAIGQVGYLKQSRIHRIPGGNNLTFSAWINIPVDSSIMGSESENEFVDALYLSVLYVDGTVDHTRKALPLSTAVDSPTTGNPQDSKWERVSCTLALSKDVYQFTCMVAVDATTQSRRHVVYIDALQLEIGSTPTQWRDNPDDGPPWLSEPDENKRFGPLDVHILSAVGSSSITINSTTVNTATSPKRRLFFTDKINEFGDHAIPTKINAITALTTTTLPITISSRKFGLYTNEIDKTSFPILWRVNTGDRSKIQRYLEGPEDVLGTYDLADRDIDHGSFNIYGVAIDQYPTGNYQLDIKDITVLNGQIWAFCKETFDGNYFYTVKVISTDSYPTTGFEYLEIINDMAINSGDAITFNDSVETGGIVFSSIAHVDGDLSQLVIATDKTPTADYYQIDLDYDYYMVANDRGQIITRKQYTGDLIMT